MKSILFSFVLSMLAFVANGKTNGNTDSIFTYPFSQGDSKWKEFKTPQERITALQVPKNSLSLISTEELLYVCLDYPYLSDVLAYDDIDMGFRVVVSKFNGFQEFLTRQDKADVLINVFQRISTENLFLSCGSDLEVGRNSLKIYVLSYMLECAERDNQKQGILELIQKTIDKVSQLTPFSQSLGLSGLQSLKQIISNPSQRQIYGDYYSVTRYTPNSSPVLAWKLFQNELSESDKNTLAYYAVNNYGATIISEATRNYNCHAYAWHMTEGGDTVWIGLNSLTDENVYWEDNSYMEVPESIATKVSYYESESTNHSAIRINNSLYRSKWGAWPLVEHAPDACPYYSSLPKKYYIRTPTISGPTIPDNYSVYFLENLPTSVTVTWSLTGDDASFFTLQNNTPSTNQCTVTRIENGSHNGSIYLTLTAQIISNNTIIKTVTKQLVAAYIDGPDVPCGLSIYHVVNCPENDTVVWSATGQGLQPYIDPNGAQPDVPMPYVINNDGSGTVDGILTADIRAGNSSVGTVSRKIDEYSFFTGTWYQQATATDTVNSTPRTFVGNSGLFDIVPGRKVYLQSSQIPDAIVTHSSTGHVIEFDWSNSNGVISFLPFALPNKSGSVIVNGSYPSSCKTFSFRFRVLPPLSDPLLMSSDGNLYEFSIGEGSDTDSEMSRGVGNISSWQLIIEDHMGRQVYSRQVSNSNKCQVNTAGWKPGVYIAIAQVGDQYYSMKFSKK